MALGPEEVVIGKWKDRVVVNARKPIRKKWGLPRCKCPPSFRRGEESVNLPTSFSLPARYRFYDPLAFSLDLRIAGETRLPSYRKENEEFTTTLGAWALRFPWTRSQLQLEPKSKFTKRAQKSEGLYHSTYRWSTGILSDLKLKLQALVHSSASISWSCSRCLPRARVHLISRIEKSSVCSISKIYCIIFVVRYVYMMYYFLVSLQFKSGFLFHLRILLYENIDCFFRYPKKPAFRDNQLVLSRK